MQMRKGMFLKLVFDNIKRNKGTYIPYMIMCIFCISMTYMMFFITQSPDLDQAVPSAEEVSIIIFLGIWIIVIFSVIFLMYSNGFLMKRRQKEIGLYNILGMEKSHISKMLCMETILTSVISLAAGILVGILGSKLALLFLFKLLRVPARLGFYVCGSGIVMCAGIFGVIFVLILLRNMRRIHLNQPVELLRAGSAGEREPKAKWLIALAGFICLGAGYYIAVTTTSPMDALLLFFVAVLLVMVGTYLVFTAGSIAVLKMMRWKKSFYYKTKNFTAVSGMLYRMKQNAVGLASICILSTGVLLMISATLCLNIGLEDIMKNRYPYDVYFTAGGIAQENAADFREAFVESLEKNNVPCKESITQYTLTFACLNRDGQLLITKPDSPSTNDLGYLTLMTDEEYSQVSGNNIQLNQGQILCYMDGKEWAKTLKINDKTFEVKEWMKKWPSKDQDEYVFRNICVVVCEEDFIQLEQLQKEIYADYYSSPVLDMGVNIEGSKDDQIRYGNLVKADLNEFTKTAREAGEMTDDTYLMGGIRQEEYDSYYANYGGLLFLGIFLGSLFLLGAAMIIYYKQMSEGYEDKSRFEIMQKVGMSRKEVKATIRRQIVMVFFLPLIMAVVHICMAFPMIRRLLLLFGMTNTHLFMLCTAVTVVGFAVVYGVIYSMTAKSYYRIVRLMSAG